MEGPALGKAFLIKAKSAKAPEAGGDLVGLAKRGMALVIRERRAGVELKRLS